LTCTLDVGGNFLYTFDNFVYVPIAGSGGGHSYVGGDVAIDLSSGGANLANITFSKVPNTPTAGLSFFANIDEFAGVRFTYDVTLTPILPGTVAFTGDQLVSYNESFASNGSPALQMIIANPPTGESCNVSPSDDTDECALPAGTTNFLNTGNILTLTGNSGNAAVLNFSNVYNAQFTADTGGSGIPEPSTWVMMGVGLAALPLLRKKPTSRR